MHDQFIQRNPSTCFQQEAGYSLLELMVVMTIIALLSTLAVPTYQYYLQKTALVQAVQAALPYKIAVSLCALESGASSEGSIPDTCCSGEHGIPTPEATASLHLESIAVEPRGQIRIIGQRRLQGLEIMLTPKFNSSGSLTWEAECTSAGDPALTRLCQKTFS